MIEYIEIKNFKSIENLKIPGLKRVNLISGRNNTGKSSVLEALVLYGYEWSPKGLLKVLGNRRRVPYSELQLYDIRSLFNRTNTSDFIEIGFENNVCTIYSTVFDSKNRNSSKIKEDIEKYRYSRGYEIHYSSEIEKAKKQFPIESIDDAVKYIEANAEEADKIRWIAFCENNEEYLSALYDKITLTDLENSVVEGLQIIEPDIERLAFVSGKTGEGRHAVVKMKGNGIYPLSEMGDGINRILHIILSLVNAENGFLLIDEIENGLHYSALEQLWKVIFVLSEKLNVQVFATTHSVDCIQSFALHPDEENKNYFRLDKVDGEITVEDYSSEELKIAVQNDIETRA